jgi:hypothetical protein
MACSKIFSGDLPELIDEIIQYFRKDLSTLYSCILVNRLWCRLAIPLLWEDPFSIPTQNYHYIEIYLYYLNEDGKAKFNEYGINNNLLISNPLFNYPSFIKYLNIRHICYSIEKWIETIKINNYDSNLKNFVYKSLIEVFIENEGELHSFEVVAPMSNDFGYFNDTMELTLQNPNFTYNIKNLKFHIGHSYPNITNIIPFLKFLSSNCNSISSVVLKFLTYDEDNFLLIEKYLLQIIISQHNLRIISFEYDDILCYPILWLKNPNCSNTLNTIIFNGIDFKNIIPILKEVFDQLNVLKSIHIIYCISLNSDFVQQIIKVIKPFKLKTLFMSEILHIESFHLLLQKFGDGLENFGLEPMRNTYKQQVFELTIKYCTKIRYFDPGTSDDNIYPLIKSNEQNINYLNIEVSTYSESTISSSVLKNLGQVLPSKLEYLSLTLFFNTNDLKIFLKNSQNIFIKKLLFSNLIKDENYDNILFYIKDYIMKKERVKYLAILDRCGSDGYEEDLFILKDEVNEFKLYNIIVERYCELYISAQNFVKYYMQF